MTMWSATFENVTVSALQDLFELVAPTDQTVCIHRVLVSQNSDAGDAEAEMARVRFIRGHATSGSGGSTATPVDLGTSGATYTGTCEINNTTPASSGGASVHVEGFNVQAGLDYMPPPEQRIWLKPSQRLVVNLPAAPADGLSVDGTLIYETP